MFCNAKSISFYFILNNYFIYLFVMIIIIKKSFMLRNKESIMPQSLCMIVYALCSFFFFLTLSLSSLPCVNLFVKRRIIFTDCMRMIKKKNRENLVSTITLLRLIVGKPFLPTSCYRVLTNVWLILLCNLPYFHLADWGVGWYNLARDEN